MQIQAARSENQFANTCMVPLDKYRTICKLHLYVCLDHHRLSLEFKDNQASSSAIAEHLLLRDWTWLDLKLWRQMIASNQAEGID